MLCLLWGFYLQNDAKDDVFGFFVQLFIVIVIDSTFEKDVCEAGDNDVSSTMIIVTTFLSTATHSYFDYVLLLLYS